MDIGLAITGGIESLDEVNIEAIVSSGVSSLLIGCYEDELRWEAERMAAFVLEARRSGLECYAIPWGYGRLLDPDPRIPSLYVHTWPQTLQIDSRGRRCPKACPNDPRFLEWFNSSIRTLAWLLEVNGFVWDEPSFHYSRGTWSCRCEYCQRLFRGSYDKELPKRLTPEVLEFRRQSIAMFLLAARAAIHAVDRRLRSIVMPPPLASSSFRYTGADDWALLADSAAVDAVSLLAVGDDESFIHSKMATYTDAASAVAARGKQLWVWVTSDLEDTASVVRQEQLATSLGAERLVVADYISLVELHGLERMTRILAKLAR